MKCTHCNKPIILKPSAKERAQQYGGKPSDYAKLFPRHAECELELHQISTKELMRRLNK